MNNSDLIQKLAASHQKKPFWKDRHALLSLWFALTIGYYFLAIGLFSKSDPHSSFIFLGLSGLTAFLGWFFFTQHLNEVKSTQKLDRWGLILIPGVLGVAYLVDNFFEKTILHHRGLVLTQGDVNCFSHTVLVSLLPILGSICLMRYFFISQKIKSYLFLSVQLSLLSAIWIDMSCADREFWHLIMGHQSSLLGIFAIAIFSGYLLKRRSSLTF